MLTCSVVPVSGLDRVTNALTIPLRRKISVLVPQRTLVLVVLVKQHDPPRLQSIINAFHTALSSRLRKLLAPG